MCRYLWSKDIQNTDHYLCLAPHYSVIDVPLIEELQLEEEDMVVVNAGMEEEMTTMDPRRMLILDNVRPKGFLKDSLCMGGMGLDYEHTVLLVARLARMHAVSYSMRRETLMDMEVELPQLDNSELPIFRTSHTTFVR